VQLLRYFGVSLVSFTAVTLCIASQHMFIFVSIYFAIDSVRKLFDILPFVVSAMKDFEFHW